MSAIAVHGLRKVYRTRRGPVTALDGLDLEVPSGGVFGFLGANGAGKTTAIRALVGHLRAEGSVRVLGAPVPGRLADVIDRVGALVEAPSFFPNFSGRRNLALLARSRGIPAARVDAVLDTVGLADRAGSRFATYSLGMRQRLGVAAALLKDPELLVLDEPANGLDPAGILEIRTLLRRLAGEGRTVFVSSHILAEVQQTADRVAIVDRGRTVASGTVDELLRSGAHQLLVRVPGPRDGAARALTLAGFAVEAGERDSLTVTIAPAVAAGAAEHPPREDPDAVASRVSAVLAAAGIHLCELRPVERSLEQAFLALTGGADRPGEPARPGASEPA